MAARSSYASTCSSSSASAITVPLPRRMPPEGYTAAAVNPRLRSSLRRDASGGGWSAIRTCECTRLFQWAPRSSGGFAISIKTAASISPGYTVSPSPDQTRASGGTTTVWPTDSTTPSRMTIVAFSNVRPGAVTTVVLTIACVRRSAGRIPLTGAVWAKDSVPGPHATAAAATTTPNLNSCIECPFPKTTQFSFYSHLHQGRSPIDRRGGVCPLPRLASPVVGGDKPVPLRCARRNRAW